MGVAAKLTMLFLISVVLQQACSYPFDEDVFFDLDNEGKTFTHIVYYHICHVYDV